MAGIPLKRPRSESTEVKLDKCIICQTVRQQSTTSTPDGRARIKEAADIRRDDVYERLSGLESENFVYHVSNDCYKKYTHKTLLEKLKQSRPTTDINEHDATSAIQTPRHSRSQCSPREPVTSPDIRATKKTCVICCQFKNKGDYEKHRISESPRAQKFLSAACHLQDDVYTRTCDLQDEHAVFGADLYYHTNCMRKYIKRYEDGIKQKHNTSKPHTDRRLSFQQFMNSISFKLQKGDGFALSDLRDQINSNIAGEMKPFSNKEMRVLLYDHFGSNVCFAESRDANRSAMVFLKHVTTEEVIDNLRSTDIVDKCAMLLRESLLETDFNLGDKFSDANDLRQSWTNTPVPEVLLRFFGGLFNFDHKSFYGSASNDTDILENDEDEESIDTANNQGMSDIKRRKMRALHQIMYFNVHNGSKRTPLHILNAQSIHDKCKSKELITSLNHYGLAISYNELQRYHNDMARLIVQSSFGNVPMPSQFDPEMFTIAAFDNFDHEEATLSGIKGSHDTVSVLFQEKPKRTFSKPNISETNIVHGNKVFQQQLKCQELQPYIKPAKKPDLPPDYCVKEELFTASTEEALKTDCAWLLGRIDLSSVSEGSIGTENKNQRMPSWSAFNSVVSKETLSEKIVGFLPVIPSPVTDHQTVYTALKNFQDILKQLSQTHLAVTCDEGVYHIAREITMGNSAEFENLVLCLGSFHMTKILIGCIGKYLRNSGAESIWIENSVFGPNVVQSVLGGTHYVRAFKGMILLCETMERLQWLAFFKAQDPETYQEELLTLIRLQDSIANKEADRSRELLEEFHNSSANMTESFHKFRSDGSNQSETFQYWNMFIALVALLRNLVRADREGEWSLHLNTVQSILPYFALFDCVNYLRWCSLYLEDMRSLPETAPEIHQAFLQGQFVVKRTPGKFKAVAADQSLEQTINRSQKSSGGIIGSTRKKVFVAEWEMIYHEMIAVSSLHRELSGSKPFYHELTVNHEFSDAETKARESNVRDMMEYIELYENPFQITEGTEKHLHNIISQEVMPSEVRESLLSVESKGSQLYNSFRKERFTKRTKKLSDTIHRNNIKTFQTIKSVKPSVTAIKKKKINEAAAGHRVLEIAQARGFSTKELFSYDLIQTSYLYDDGGLMKKPVKSALCHELEKCLNSADMVPPSDWKSIGTAYLLDVMANVRKISTKGLRTFADLCSNFLNMMLAICKNANRIDLVFDSYNEGSVKDTERSRRSTVTPIEISIVAEDTPLPVNMDTFWASISNKAKLQALLRKFVIENAENMCPEVELVFSGFCAQSMSLPCQSQKEGCLLSLPELDLTIEEADVRLIPHSIHATQAGAKRLVILSGDTDVMVLALYFYPDLKTNGLCELWMRAGLGDTTRYIPLHLIAERKHELCTVLPAIHILTGCDTTSKVGTKLSALKPPAVQLLSEFGKSLSSPNQDEIIGKAEEYLVQVLKPNSTCTTMDNLRYDIYHQSKVSDLHSLPPTSSDLHLHILRCLYTTYMQIHCRQNVTVDAANYGYEERNGSLVPSYHPNNVPESLVQTCNCKKCSTKQCACRKIGIPCCVYCKCKNVSGQYCMNPYVVVSVPLTL